MRWFAALFVFLLCVTVGIVSGAMSYLTLFMAACFAFATFRTVDY